MRSAFLLLTLLIGAQTFHILQNPNSKTHQDMTRMAILLATANICKSVENNFKAPAPLNSEMLAEACHQKTFASNFEKGIRIISYNNVMTDLNNIFGQHPEQHFDNEKFQEGKQVITSGLIAITNDIEKERFDDARKKLGTILHVLQDFYSHTNWIELGYTEPCTALIDPEENIPNPANKHMVTCDDSPNGKSANIKDEIIKGKILTSGYVRKSKPKGKCSHGGFPDFKEGINKDYSDSSHGPLHTTAAKVAIDASVQLLEKIWRSLKKDQALIFFKLMGLCNETPKGEWKYRISLFNFKDSYPDATEEDIVDV
ncbi:hypothetical protein QQF64_026040 [Cirrhinus molitorella]|uniref:VWA7 N-terminal domain-containing protein n=1 Tax=Cirrhinus molitorella TaxID=172907 RepID=A0ABR3NR65_9TELE